MDEEIQISTVTPKTLPYREQKRLELRRAILIAAEEAEEPLSRSTSVFTDAIAVGRFMLSIIPPLLSLGWALIMGTKQRIAIAVVALLAAVLAHFSIQIPAELEGVLASGVAFLIGWLIPNAKKD